MFGLRIIKVQGHSMEPTIKAGSFVLVMDTPILQLGDIVLLQLPNKEKMIKRITNITPEGYFVEGDNKNDSYDSRDFGIIPKEKMLGKIIWF